MGDCQSIRMEPSRSEWIWEQIKGNSGHIERVRLDTIDIERDGSQGEVLPPV